mmetsp:Transcript_28361/g.64228  ORF Transcript_28361/g.64228 Transcript_28361/m.64228 type:complete len:230 (+) Transcript_28361:3-692(+)
MTAMVRGGGDRLWSMAAVPIRMIHAHMTTGRCQSSSYFFMTFASTGVSMSDCTSLFMSGLFRAACTSSSTEAKPYLATCVRTCVHFFSLSSLLSSMLMLAKASMTLPSAVTRSCHQRVSVSDTYRPRTKGTKAEMCAAICSRGKTLTCCNLSNWKMKTMTMSRQDPAQMTTMSSTLWRQVWSIVKTVPSEKMVLRALCLTRAFMSYRRIFLLPAALKTVVVISVSKRSS